MIRSLAVAMARQLGFTITRGGRSFVNAQPVRRFQPRLEACESRDVPTAVVTVVPLVASVTEGDSFTAAFRVSRTETSGFLSVSYGYSGTAGSSDFTDQLIVSFGDGEATKDVVITPSDDNLSEPTETITFNVNSGSGYTVGTASSATVNLLDNDAQVVTVAKTDDASESGLAGTFTFTRIGNLSSSLSVNYTVGGTATSGTDFTALAGTATFAAGANTTTVSVVPIDDTAYDPGETVVVTLGSGTGYSVGTASSDTVTIADSTQVTFTLNSYVVAVKYTIPWGSVDPTAANQSLTPSAFNLSIGGQDFAYGAANYTSGPTLLFEYGDLVGVEFALNPTGSPFTSISLSNGTVTGIDAATNVFTAPIQNREAASITIDFSSIVIPAGAAEVKLRVTVAGGAQKIATVEIQPGATKEQVRNLFKTALSGLGFGVEPYGTTDLAIKGTAMAELTKIEALEFGGNSPKLVGRTKGDGTSLPAYVP